MEGREGREKVITQKLLTTALCTILVFLSIISSVRAQGVIPIVSILPPNQVVDVCSNFDIEVKIRNVGARGLKNYTLSVVYDKNKVEPLEVRPGAYLGGVCAVKVDARGFISVQQIHKNGPNAWTVAAGGSLFEVEFHCIAPGVSPLAFSFLAPGPRLDLFDKDGIQYSYMLEFDVENAEVTQRTVEDGGFSIPVDKFGLLAPYLGVTSIILVATVAAAIYVKRINRKKEDQ